MREALQGKFGMYEMEAAADIILNKIQIHGPDVSFSYQDFQKDHDAMKGFCEFLHRGWMERATFNGNFKADKAFLERTKDMITADIAYNLRFERGLSLPVDREYDNPRIKEIAIEQATLLKRLSELDGELVKLAGDMGTLTSGSESDS